MSSVSPRPLISSTAAWSALHQHVHEIEQTHLRNLLEDAQRCKQTMVNIENKQKINQPINQYSLFIYLVIR